MDPFFRRFWVLITIHRLCADALVTNHQLSQISSLKHSGADPEPSKIQVAPLLSRQKRLLPTNQQNAAPDNALTNYDFEYKIHGGGNFFGHAEKRNGIETNGEYFVILPDFRRQVVKYYVDTTGYHATVSYEPITSVGNEKTINLLPPSSLDRRGTHSSSRRRNSYKKIVRKRVPKTRRSTSDGPE